MFAYYRFCVYFFILLLILPSLLRFINFVIPLSKYMFRLHTTLNLISFFFSLNYVFLASSSFFFSLVWFVFLCLMVLSGIMTTVRWEFCIVVANKIWVGRYRQCVVRYPIYSIVFYIQAFSMFKLKFWVGFWFKNLAQLFKKMITWVEDWARHDF